MKTALSIPLAICLVFFVGCTSKLSVKNEHVAGTNASNSKYCEDKGVPTASLEPHIVTKIVQFLDKSGKLCKQVETSEFQMLPSGNKYCLNIDPSWFAKDELTVELADNGALQKVLMNSDPQLDETISATANLVKEIGGLLPAAALDAKISEEVDEKTCGQQTKVFNKSLLTYQQWKKLLHP